MLEPLPLIEPRLRPSRSYARALPANAALRWLTAGWVDFRYSPFESLLYGVVVFALSALVIGGLIAADLLWLIFPASSGFLVVGPLFASGLYQKSRDRQSRLRDMLLVKPRSPGQLAFAGLLLCLLVVLWLRAADLLYALFYGLLPFPGFDHVLAALLTTPRGWALIITGSAVGGLFAAFAMAISLFSIPMLLERRTDALTAFGTSLAMTTQNLRCALPWAIIVTLGFALCAITGLLGLIVIFPVLGYGTWHAWVDLRPESEAEEQ
jgi:uncharacterized membrane protein